MSSVSPGSDELSRLSEWATPRQREAVEALVQHRNITAAARALGIARQTCQSLIAGARARAAKRGWAPGHDMTQTVPEGFHVKGVSTLYDADGIKRAQWVKSRADQESQLKLLAEAVQELAEPFRGVAKPAKVPKVLNDDLLCVYPMGDPHLGMFAWHQETGQDFDLQIAENNLVAAVDKLVQAAPPARHALIINLGDFFHSDSKRNETTAGTAVDVDTRWAKVLAVGIRTMRRCIDRALKKHEFVTVICEIGNHDDHSAIMLALCLAEYYSREPRVTIDTSPAKFHWYRFGANLLGVTHGNGLKAQALPGIMAVDRQVDWGETRYRFWYCGHVHHDSVKEFPGCTVETFRTLAARDAWHHGSGYRSGQDMKCDVLHREYGRVSRNIIGIHQIWAEAPIAPRKSRHGG